MKSKFDEHKLDFYKGFEGKTFKLFLAARVLVLIGKIEIPASTHHQFIADSEMDIPDDDEDKKAQITHAKTLIAF